MDDERVTGLGPLDIKGTGLRIDVAQIHLGCREVIDRLEREVEGVLRPQLHDGAGCHPCDRRCTTEGVGKLMRLGAELQDLGHARTLAFVDYQRILIRPNRASGRTPGRGR